MKAKQAIAPSMPSRPGTDRRPSRAPGTPLQRALTQSERVRAQGKLADEVNRSPRARPENAAKELVLLHSELALTEEEQKKRGRR